MYMKYFLSWCDYMVCSYLGFSSEEVKPFSVKLVNKKLFIFSTGSFRRHVIKQRWDNSNRISLDHIPNKEKEKLGFALGKVLANDLTISFQESENTERGM